MSRLLWFLLSVAFARQAPLFTSHSHWEASLALSDSHCALVQQPARTQHHRALSPTSPVFIASRPLSSLPIHSSSSTSKYVTITAISKQLVLDNIERICPFGVTSENEPAELSHDKIYRVISSGRPENRIDVVFMGDGYTANESAVFESDIRRLVNDMWTGQTFASTLPLFNIWAVFRPSKEHGIGTNGKPKNTAFGLYRDGTELRGIYTSKPNAARQACKQLGPFSCDYPSLIANDLYYGGLGGEFVISTSSPTSGTIVLRHEMGHNFVAVGEEYDGGYVYQGCNAADSLENVPWKTWLSNPNNIREERSVLRVQKYAWYDLSNGPYIVDFESDGSFNRWLLKISVSGVESNNSFRLFLDDHPLNWTSSGTLDRSFSEWLNITSGFSAGKHTLRFEQGYPPASPESPIRQLCSITLHEFGDESEFHINNNIVSMYPTWSIDDKKSYRPTNEGCLMRNMSSTSFCPICVEGLWQNLLLRVSLIDELVEDCDYADDGTLIHVLRLIPVSLAQFRAPDRRIHGERYRVTWRRDGQIIKNYTDAFEIDLEFDYRIYGSVPSLYSVELVFETPEVRTDKYGVLTATADWVPRSQCE